MRACMLFELTSDNWLYVNLATGSPVNTDYSRI